MNALATTPIARADRHALNRALHAAGLPTLGNARTRAQYLVHIERPETTFDAKQAAQARKALGMPAVKAPRKAQPKAAPVVREVPEFIARRAYNKARVEAGLARMTAEEFATLRSLVSA